MPAVARRKAAAVTENNDGRDLPRRFLLERHADPSGLSGTGVVAEGVEFTDGSVTMRWVSRWPTSTVFHGHGIESVQAVHGHAGQTEVVWLDD